MHARAVVDTIAAELGVAEAVFRGYWQNEAPLGFFWRFAGSRRIRFGLMIVDSTLTGMRWLNPRRFCAFG